MQKIIYIILSLILLAALVFGGLYFNGNYNDKSQLSNASKGSPNLNMAEKNITKKEDEVTFFKTGTFNRIDPVHYASGDVNISSDENYYYIDFQNNFSSANGPDLYVYLSSKQKYKNIAIGGIDTGKTLNVGKLNNLSGYQSYKVSKEEFEKYSDSVIIWCKDFGIQFSRAELR